jgi:hypothetical protein
MYGAAQTTQSASSSPESRNSRSSVFFTHLLRAWAQDKQIESRQRKHILRHRSRPMLRRVRGVLRIDPNQGVSVKYMCLMRSPVCPFASWSDNDTWRRRKRAADHSDHSHARDRTGSSPDRQRAEGKAQSGWERARSRPGCSEERELSSRRAD